MKGRFFQYFMLVAALLVWGLIVMRVTDYTKNKNEQEISNRMPLHDTQTIADKEIKTTLSLNYNNPFVELLGNELESINNEPIDGYDEQEYLIPQVVNWPQLQYFGLVENRKNKATTLAMISISEKEYLVKKGEMVSNIKIINVFRDSIVLIFKNEKKTYNKNE